MKYHMIKSIVIAMIMTLSTLTAWAEEDQPTASADIGIFNKYIWRGYELSDDSIVIQPVTSIGYKNMNLSLWGNVDSALDDSDPTTTDKNAWNETDFTLAYGTSYGMLNVELGYIYYGLDGLDDTQEMYVSFGTDTLFSPALTIYKDIGTLPGWYFSLGLSHSIDVSEGFTLDLAASMGYYISEDDDFVEVDSDLNLTTNKYSGLHDGMISASTTFPMGQYISLTPMVAYSFPLSKKADYLIQSTSFADDSDFLYGGITFSIAF